MLLKPRTNLEVSIRPSNPMLKPRWIYSCICLDRCVMYMDTTDARRKVAGLLLFKMHDSAIACGDFRHGLNLYRAFARVSRRAEVVT
jgi:hypothetical protein